MKYVRIVFDFVVSVIKKVVCFFHKHKIGRAHV